MSKEDDLPSWLNEDLPGSAKPAVQPYKPPQHSGAPDPETSSDSGAAPLPLSLRRKKEAVYWCMKGLTITLCFLMSLTAVMGVMSVNGINDAERIMVGISMILLSSLLAVFEIIQVKTWDSIDRVYRRNFGFLYGTKGKAFYIIL